MMPLGADPAAPTTEVLSTEERTVLFSRDGVAVGALATFVLSLTAAGFCVSAALGFAALALAALVVALLIGLR